MSVVTTDEVTAELPVDRFDDRTGEPPSATGNGGSAGKESRQSEADLRDLCMRIVKVREEEKRSIAGEIHDELGQLLTALRMNISFLRESGRLDSFSLTKLQCMESLVDDILERVRDIASTLRPKVLDLGLAPAIEWLVQQFTDHTGIICSLSIAEVDLSVLDADKTTAVFRIVQESLTNAARHADAQRVEVSLAPWNSFIQLRIQDDGVGFDPEAVQITKSGLSGIRERSFVLDAEFNIESSATAGTILEVLIPRPQASMPDRLREPHRQVRVRMRRRRNS